MSEAVDTNEASRRDAGEQGLPETYPVAARRLLRETLLDAALVELRDRDWDEITMADIARTAGVSRQTLYNEFGNREEFSQAFVLREGDRFLTAVDDAILSNVDDPGTAINAAFECFLQAADSHPLVRSALGDHGADTILPLLTTESGPVIEFAATRLAATISRGWPQARDSDVGLLAEMLVRLAISHLSVRSDAIEETASNVSRLLEPFVVAALAQARQSQS